MQEEVIPKTAVVYPVTVRYRHYRNHDSLQRVGQLQKIHLHTVSRNSTDSILFPLLPEGHSIEREVVLYWNPIEKNINPYEYFEPLGYQPVPQPHISLLIQALSHFTEEKLTEMGIPDHVSISFFVPKENLLSRLDHTDFSFNDRENSINRYMMQVYRSEGKRSLYVGADIYSPFCAISHAFLLSSIEK